MPEPPDSSGSKTRNLFPPTCSWGLRNDTGEASICKNRRLLNVKPQVSYQQYTQNVIVYIFYHCKIKGFSCVCAQERDYFLKYHGKGTQILRPEQTQACPRTAEHVWVLLQSKIRTADFTAVKFFLHERGLFPSALFLFWERKEDWISSFTSFWSIPLYCSVHVYSDTITDKAKANPSLKLTQPRLLDF